MERWIRELIDREKAKRGVPLEVKPSGNNYYLYQVTSVWDKEAKKRRKISRYIGKVNQDGLVKENRRTIYEYGNSKLLHLIVKEIEQALRKSFPDHYQEIMAISMIRNVAPTPIKLMKARWEKLFTSTEMDAHLSPNSVSAMLRSIGSDYDAQRRFFASMIRGSKYLIFDMSSIFSRSENIRMADKGYNKNRLQTRQIGMVMFFSHEKRMPVILKPVPGSLRDPKTFLTAAREYSIKRCVVIADRGSSPGTFIKMGMDFIVPLKDNSRMIDYSLGIEKSFPYNGRGINSSRKRIGDLILYMFEDTMLRYEEESNFISMISKGKRSQNSIESMRSGFGKIPILSTLDVDPEDLYTMYKTREDVEQAFDAMKNELEEDKTYLQDDDSVRGYFFTIFTALYVHYRILNILKDEGINGKMSVKEVLLELSRVYAIEKGGRKTLSEIPKRAEEIENLLGIKLFPKIPRS